MSKIIKTIWGNYLMSESAVNNIQTQGDILDLIVDCAEAGSNRVLISEDSLHSDFFDLSTGTT
jgi:hypothetical protein